LDERDTEVLHRERRRPLLAWVAILIVGIAVAFLAADQVSGRLSPSVSPEAHRDSVRSQTATLGRTIHRLASAGWDVERSIWSPAGGTVTELRAGPGHVKPGDVLMRLDERPMVVIAGDLPVFRALGPGATGRDVAAVQQFLRSRGSAVDPVDTRYSAITATAVTEWQASLGQPSDGTLPLGSFILVPERTLDAPLRWVDGLSVGRLLTPGEQVLDGLEDAPKLALDLSGSSAGYLAPGTSGTTHFPGGVDEPVVLTEIRSEPGRVWGVLDAADPPFCLPTTCLDLVPLEGVPSVPVDLTVVPETTGVQIPLVAIKTDASGRSFVESIDGTRWDVTIVVAVGGLAIVDGIPPGLEVVLP
jgi:peptidoglycan hydrolase-like protein with peptidoglycan-binding domain